MTKKERIAELERKVAELEARPPIVHYPYVSVPSAWIGSPCPACGTYGSHACMGRFWNTTTSGATDRLDYSNITVMGAAS